MSDFIKQTLRDAMYLTPRWNFDEQQADAWHHNWTWEQFKVEIDALTSKLAAAEGWKDAFMRALEDEKVWRDRAEKAEAERDRLRDGLRIVRGCLLAEGDRWLNTADKIAALLEGK